MTNLKFERRVGIIILNYNNFMDTILCIESIEKINYSNFFIIIVDNNSKDESVNKITKFIKDRHSYNIELLTLNQNIGYAGGNNAGIRVALEKNADYICVLNNDTIVSSQFLKILIDFMEEDNHIGICGPCILEYDEKDIVQSAGGNINFLSGNVNPLYNGKKIDDLPKEIMCDYVGGACLIVSKDVLNNIGLIPEDYFLFFEETDWCYQAKRSGYNIVCKTDAMIWHKGSASIRKISGLSEYLMERNRMYFIKKNSNFVNITISYIYLSVRAIYRGVRQDRRYFKYIRYYFHGLTNAIMKEYDFISINYTNH